MPFINLQTGVCVCCKLGEGEMRSWSAFLFFSHQESQNKWSVFKFAGTHKNIVAAAGLKAIAEVTQF